MTEGALCFGRFRLDLARRQLLLDERPLQLGDRALQVLRVLAEASGALVSKDELMARVWAGQVVEENNLQVQISALRKMLDPEGTGESWIVTVPGRGYRLLDLKNAGSHADRPPAGPAPAYQNNLPHRLRHKADSQDSRPNSPAMPSDRASLAVLPFQNMSGDPGQDYFADGMTEEIITALSRIPSFVVVSRHSTFAYKGKSPDIRQVGREPAVRYVLEGSVRKSSERMRISGQLIDTVSGVHLWADRFDVPVADTFDVQDQITASVVGAIEPKLRQAEIERARRKPADNLQAYDLLLRSRFTFGQQTRDALEESYRLLQHAVELDPNYSLALAWLARTQWSIDSQHFRFPSAAEVDRYVHLAQRAVELAPDDPEVLVVASLVISQPGCDPTEATALVDRALGLNPNSAEAWAMSGMLRALAGEVETALEHLDRSVQLCPMNLWANWHNAAFAWTHFAAGCYEEALVWIERGLRRNPNHVVFLKHKAAVLGLLGRTNEARQVVHHLCTSVPDLTISRLRDIGLILHDHSSGRVSLRDAQFEGLRRAGLPE
jgi:TolB-like protein/DNA-binding winged helix-turn-helix (wHTH) protein